MRHLRHQFHVSHMTVFRALKKQGYHTSYNRNAAYYTLADVPEFDAWGLWAYRDVRFSRFGSLPDTLVGLVGQAPAGLTCEELEDRLQTQVANLLSRLMRHGRLQRQRLPGRQVVYLSPGPEHTVEPGTPVFLGVREAASGLFLLGRKIPSKNIDDIRPCLQEAASQYGRLLARAPLEVPFDDRLGRGVLLAFHFWILGKSDTQRYYDASGQPRYRQGAQAEGLSVKQATCLHEQTSQKSCN